MRDSPGDRVFRRDERATRERVGLLHEVLQVPCYEPCEVDCAQRYVLITRTQLTCEKVERFLPLTKRHASAMLTKTRSVSVFLGDPRKNADPQNRVDERTTWRYRSSSYPARWPGFGGTIYCFRKS